MRYSCCVWWVKIDLVCSEGRQDRSDLKSGIIQYVGVSWPDILPCGVFPEDKQARSLLNVTYSQSESKVTETQQGITMNSHAWGAKCKNSAKKKFTVIFVI
ncbi:hypothetical protein XENORESO_021860 [Xenotaenia resolanae]|uniref:Uncharacterized protein n=1 Tax=Xenotaenia resolanae TaxID=208358 RepID=A0ABV0W645_9TELE